MYIIINIHSQNIYYVLRSLYLASKWSTFFFFSRVRLRHDENTILKNGWIQFSNEPKIIGGPKGTIFVATNVLMSITKI